MEAMDIIQVTASEGAQHAVATERTDGPIGTCDLLARRTLRLFGVAHLDCLLRRPWRETIDDCSRSVFFRLAWSMASASGLEDGDPSSRGRSQVLVTPDCSPTGLTLASTDLERICSRPYRAVSVKPPRLALLLSGC